MGKLKDFLFEKVEAEVSYDELYDTYLEDISVNTENVTQDNLINDIYNQNDLSDLSKSIFKVEELINSLPKEMPNETKKATVLSMLSIFGLTLDEVIEDGQNRCSTINIALSSIESENNDVIQSNIANIEQKKLEIQSLEKDNADRYSIIKETADKIEAEAKRIEELVKFVGGAV